MHATSCISCISRAIQVAYLKKLVIPRYDDVNNNMYTCIQYIYNIHSKISIKHFLIIKELKRINYFYDTQKRSNEISNPTKICIKSAPN